MMYDIVYTDTKRSSDWQVLVKTPLIPKIGELINLGSKAGTVFSIEHVHQTDRGDSRIVLHYLKIYLDLV